MEDLGDAVDHSGPFRVKRQKGFVQSKGLNGCIERGCNRKVVGFSGLRGYAWVTLKIMEPFWL